MNRDSHPTARAPRLRLSRRGFGMTEVLVAATLVGVIVVGALNAIGMAFRAQRSNAERSIRFALAQELMASQLARPYGNLSSTAGSVDHADYSNWDFTIVVDNLDAATLQTSPTDGGLKRIQVTVSTPAGDETKLSGLRADGVPSAQPLAIALRVGNRSDGRNDRPQFTAAVVLNDAN